ncbi:MAG: ABC transporter substrate-binding protein [Desulfatibacillaceae bacterium]
MRLPSPRTIPFALLLAVLFLSPSVLAADGVTESEIVLGQSCALEGPVRALGLGMSTGLSAFFAAANRDGGVHGRAIRLISRDDGYEPQQAIANTREFIRDEKVFCLIGEVGTPTSRAVVPLAEQEEVPFFAPFTGAEFLRNPYKEYVVNLRASYYQEMERLAQYLVEEKGFSKIACFYQNDGYGQAGLAGIRRALERRDLELVAGDNYERNTLAVKGAILTIRRARPQAVVMVGAYQPCAEFIKQARRVGMDDVVYCNISFVGTSALLKELGEAGDGVIISQVVVFPWNRDVPVVAEYHEAMAAYGKSNPDADDRIGFVSLEGYLAGKLFFQVAEAAGKDLTREGFLEAVKSVGTYDLGGIEARFGPGDHQGLDEVFLTVIRDGKIQPLK